MCGRYYTKRQKQEIAERMRAKKVFTEAYAPDHNVAPTTFQPIVRQERDSDERELVLARWGLVPFFAKSLADFKGFSTFNARAESITSSATLRGPFKTRRCIVPADGFYEWKALDDSKKPQKRSYAISPQERRALRLRRPVGCMEAAEAEKGRTANTGHLAPELQHHHHRSQRTHVSHPHPHAGDPGRTRLEALARP